MVARHSTSLYRISVFRALPYLAIPILLYLFMVVSPLIGAVIYSLHDTFAFKLKWIGFRNYLNLVQDPIFWLSLRNNVILILVSIIFQIGPALVVMAMMSAKIVRLEKTIQAIFFFPVVISPLVTAYIWKVMYSDQFGVINKVLDLIGLKSLEQNWLGNPHVIMTTISIPLAWQYIGFYLVILLSGYTSIEGELLEAATIDGANGFQRALYIILPLMRNTINVSLLLCISGGIKIFDQVYAMSAGGPGYASSVLAMYAYDMSFSEAQYGYGSAISVAMLVISFAAILVMSIGRSATRQE